MKLNAFGLGLFTGAWLVQASYFANAMLALGSMELNEGAVKSMMAAHAVVWTTSGDDAPFELVGNTAVIYLTGALMPTVPWIYEYLEIAATSYEDVRVAMEAALSEDSIKKIIFVFDSPGGLCDGCFELADAVAKSPKPIFSIVRNRCYSAAYLIASQTSDISIERSAGAGSIGARAVFWDSSKAHKDAGYEAEVFVSGPRKADGVPGTSLTPEGRASFQAFIDTMGKMFADTVASGRKLTTAQTDILATGETWFAAEAMELGLVDRIENFDEAVARIAS